MLVQISLCRPLTENGKHSPKYVGVLMCKIILYRTLHIFCVQVFRTIINYTTMHGMNSNIKLWYIMTLQSSSGQNCNTLIKLTYFTKILLGQCNSKQLCNKPQLRLSKFFFKIGISLYDLQATSVQQSDSIININYYYYVATSGRSILYSWFLAS